MVSCAVYGWAHLKPESIPITMMANRCDGYFLFHTLCSKTIEPFNGVLKNIFGWQEQVPVKGLQRVKGLVVGAVLGNQIVLLY